MGILLAEDGSYLTAEDGSILLDEAGSPFPGLPLDLRCELDLGSTWTNVSSYVYQRDGMQPPVTLTRGRADESSQANPGAGTWEWNNRDGRFSPKNPLSPYFGQLGRNTPVRWSVPAQNNRLRLETDRASYASCPDAVGLHITGDIDIRVDLLLTDWRTAFLAGKWVNAGVGSQQCWLFQLNSDGTLQFFWSTTGSDFPSGQSTAPLSSLGRQSLRVTLAVSTGTVTFYTGAAGGADGSTWTQLGSAVVTGSTSIFAGTAVVSAGNQSGGGTVGMQGNIYELEVRSGIAGTVKAHPVFSAQTAGTTSFSDAQSNTWTMTGTAEISDRSYRWHGQMSAQPPRWDVTGRDMAVAATAGGVLRLISQGNAPLMSPMKRAVSLQAGTLAPVAYWPCEDASGATVLGSALGGPPLSVSGSPQLSSDSSFLCSAQLPVLSGSQWRSQVPAYGSNGSIVVRFLAKVGTLPASNNVLMRLTTTGRCQTVSLRVYSGGSGGLGLAGYDSSGTAVFDSGGVSWTGGVTGQAYWYSIELRPSGGSLNWQITTLAPGAAAAQSTSGSVGATTVGNVTGVWVNPDVFFTDTALGHISVQSDWVSLFSLNGPLKAWQGETAAARFARLAGENGYPARIIGPSAKSAAMGAQAIDTLSNLLQSCEDADRGQVFEPRQALALGYRTLASMYAQSPKLILDYSAAQPGGADGNAQDSGLDPTYDDLLTRNDWTLTRSAGTGPSGSTYQFQLNDGSGMSITGVGDYADTKSVNVQYDAQLPELAGWMVHAGTVDEARWPALPLNLARSEMASLYFSALDTDIGDFLELVNAPQLVVYDPVKQLAFQVTEKLGGFHYVTEFNGIPERPYEVAAAGTAHADTAGSHLDTSYASGAAVLNVDVTAGNLWTTNAADFPFSVMAAGEQMTVTDISGPPGNFLATAASGSVQNAGFEGGIGTWAATGAVTTIAASSAQVHSGAGSMAMTSTGAGTVSAAHCTAGNILTQGLPCAANDSVECSAWLLAATAGRSVQVGAAFYTSGGALIGAGPVLGTASADVTTGWTKIASTVTAPATSAFARLWVQVNSVAGASEVHYADDCAIGDVTTGAAATQSFTVTRSVNGVVKAQASAAAVNVYPSPVAAL